MRRRHCRRRAVSVNVPDLRSRRTAVIRSLGVSGIYSKTTSSLYTRELRTHRGGRGGAGVYHSRAAKESGRGRRSETRRRRRLKRRSPFMKARFKKCKAVVYARIHGHTNMLNFEFRGGGCIRNIAELPRVLEQPSSSNTYGLSCLVRTFVSEMARINSSRRHGEMGARKRSHLCACADAANLTSLL